MKIDLFTQEGYDLACGIRGADVETMPFDTPVEQKIVKWVITARIRGLTGVNPLGHGNMVRQQPGLVDEDAFRRFEFHKPTLDDFVKGALGLPDHYLLHAQAALGAIGVLNPASGHETSRLRDLVQHVRMLRYEVAGHAEMDRRRDMLSGCWEDLFGGKDER